MKTNEKRRYFGTNFSPLSSPSSGHTTATNNYVGLKTTLAGTAVRACAQMNTLYRKGLIQELVSLDCDCTPTTIESDPGLQHAALGDFYPPSHSFDSSLQFLEPPYCGASDRSRHTRAARTPFAEHTLEMGKKGQVDSKWVWSPRSSRR